MSTEESGAKLRATVLRDDLRRSPNLTWNAFVDLIAEASFTDLSEVQKVAYLAYWYDARVQSGGHRSYFEEWGIEQVDETLFALEKLGASVQRGILSQALSLWTGIAPPGGWTGNESLMGIEQAIELEACDRRYHACAKELPELLHLYLDQHIDEFIAVREEA